MPNFQRLKRTASGVSTGDPAIGELLLLLQVGTQFQHIPIFRVSS